MKEMSSKITDETMEYISILSKLELTKQEKEQAKEDMNKMLVYFEQLNELDTEGVEPMSHIFPINNVFREDEITNGNEQEAILENALEKKNGSFVVPKTIG